MQETLESVKGVMDEKTDVVCDVCGRPMVKKLGRFGFFLACTGFPECKNTKPVPLAACPRPGCGGQIVARKRKKGRGREFYGCTNYPTCDFVTYFKPTDSHVPQVRIVPRGEGGQAEGDLQVLHQSRMRLPPYQGGGQRRAERPASAADDPERPTHASPGPKGLPRGRVTQKCVTTTSSISAGSASFLPIRWSPTARTWRSTSVPRRARESPRKSAGWRRRAGSSPGSPREGLSPRSVNRMVSGVRGWYRFMERRSLVASNPFAEIRSLRTEKRLPSFLFEEEMARLVEMPSREPCPDGEAFWKLRDRAVLETLYSTGCRISELVSLDLHDVDLKNRTARVMGKGSKERNVFLGAAAVEALRAYMSLRPCHVKAAASRTARPGPRAARVHQPARGTDHGPRACASSSGSTCPGPTSASG